MRAAFHASRLLGGLAGMSLLACGGADLLLPSAGLPSELRLVSGDLQEAQTGAALPDPLVVEAVDGTGRPVVGSRILFRFVAATAGAELSPDTAETNGSGRAVAKVRLGQAPGAHPVEAIVVDGPSGLRVRFVITALAPPSPPPGGGGGGGGGGGDDDDDDGGFGGGNGGGEDGGNDGGGNDGPSRGGGDDDDDDDIDRDDRDGDDDDDDEERDSEGKGKDDHKGKGGKGKG